MPKNPAFLAGFFCLFQFTELAEGSMNLKYFWCEEYKLFYKVAC
jgi:hypothetical protein